MARPLVAIVGRPNVGKSMLFNRLVGQRLSIVEDTPGVTRDRLYAECEWCGRKFDVVDTGGIEPMTDSEILLFMREQAQIAINAADVIVLVTDIRTGVTAADKDVANMLLRSRKPVVLAVNKADSTGAEDPALYSLNLVNENPLVILWNLNSSLIPLFEEKYFEYLKKKRLDTPENRASRSGLFIEFLNDLQIRSIEEQKRFLKDELKLTALITDINMTSKFTLNSAREHLDFVDNHQYWDHPMFPVAAWQMPYEFFNSSPIVNRAGFPRYLMPVRIFG